MSYLDKLRSGRTVKARNGNQAWITYAPSAEFVRKTWGGALGSGAPGSATLTYEEAASELEALTDGPRWTAR